MTLGGDQKVDDTPALPCDLAGLDLIFNPVLPRPPYRYGLCAALLAPVHRLPCELPPGPSYPTRVSSPCSVAFVHNKNNGVEKAPGSRGIRERGTQMQIPSSVDLFFARPPRGME